MSLEQYLKWKEQISNFMKEQGESQSFIDYACDWFDHMKGSEEIDLVKMYHPAFQDKSDQQIFDFIVNQVRHIPEGLTGEEFGYTNFNSAFFFYRPLLKIQYQQEESSKQIA